MSLLMEHRVPLNDREPDAVQILRFLEGIRRDKARQAAIREQAVRLLKGVGDHDQWTQLERLTEFVKRNVIYTSDPVDSEYIRDPLLMLREIRRDGETRGDCDDHALLLAVMLESIGIPARCVAVKIREQLPPGEDYFNHVIVQAQIDGDWIDKDPCAKREPQGDYPDKLILDDDSNPQPNDPMNCTCNTLQAFATPQRRRYRLRPVRGLAVSFDWAAAGMKLFETGLNIGTQMLVNRNGQQVIVGPGSGAGGSAYAATQGQAASGQLIAGIDNKTLLLGGVALLALPRVLDAFNRRKR